MSTTNESEFFATSVSGPPGRNKVRSALRKSLVLSFSFMALPMFLYLQRKDEVEDPPPIRIQGEFVDVGVVVIDQNGQRVAGLRREDFEIYEDDVKQEITEVRAEDEPLKLVLVFDVSVSMEAALASAQKTATELVDTLHPEEEVMVLAFAQEVSVKTGWIKDKIEVKNQIARLTLAPLPWRNIPQNLSPQSLPDVNTNLYGALMDVLDAVGRLREHMGVLVFTDGVDSLDRYALKGRHLDKEAVLRRAEESFAHLYFACSESRSERFSQGRLGPIDIRRRKPRGYGSDCKFLSRVGIATGGRAFNVDSEPDFERTVQETLAALRSRYVLEYRSKQSQSGPHAIKVVVKRPNLFLSRDK